MLSKGGIDTWLEDEKGEIIHHGQSSSARSNEIHADVWIEEGQVSIVSLLDSYVIDSLIR